MEWRNKHSCCTAGAKNVRPSSLVKVVIYIVDIAVCINGNQNKMDKSPMKTSKWKENICIKYELLWLLVYHTSTHYNSYLAQAINWITDPNSRKVQLKRSPAFLQCFPNKPSRTSNHCKAVGKQGNWQKRKRNQKKKVKTR